MIIQCPTPTTCTVTGLEELNAANSPRLRDEIRAALPPACTCLELDLSTVTFVDSSGLGALVALHKTLRSRQGTLRLLRPTASVRLVFDITRLDRVFEITS